MSSKTTTNKGSKKNSKKNTNRANTAAEVVNPAPPTQEQTMTEETAVATPEAEATPAGASTTRTYNWVRQSKFGFEIYRFPGVRGTVAVSKSMFEGPAPKELTISANWAQPGEQTPAKTLTPEQIAKLQERQKKQAERLAKTNARLAKLNLATAESTPVESAPSTEASSL